MRILVIGAMALTAVLSAASFDGDLRVMGFDRSFDNGQADSKALTMGGVVRYHTPQFSSKVAA